MFYITGDCHGDFDKIMHFCRFRRTSVSDVMIILGDVGLNYYLDRKDRKYKQMLAKLPLSFLCVHGNHEARPIHISSYMEREWKGGTVYFEEEYPNIFFAKDGEIYDLDDKKCMVIGGAYSVDKAYRIMIGAPWFDDEQPSEETKKRVEDQLCKAAWKIDYVLSHTCPLKYEPTDLFLDNIDQEKVDKTTEEWLSQIERKLCYYKWYFGHFHGNRTYIRAEMLFEEIKELGSDKFIQKVGRPEHKIGEMVLFNFINGKDNIECYGRIEEINTYGTKRQPWEVSYNICGPDYRNTHEKIIYKHIQESQIENNVSFLR